MNSNEKLIIDVALIKRLIAAQFPQWQNLPVQAAPNGGWDNRTFRLGESMLVRMPSAAGYAEQVEKEQYWLPKLAPCSPRIGNLRQCGYMAMLAPATYLSKTANSAP